MFVKNIEVYYPEVEIVEYSSSKRYTRVAYWPVSPNFGLCWLVRHEMYYNSITIMHGYTCATSCETDGLYVRSDGAFHRWNGSSGHGAPAQRFRPGLMIWTITDQNF